jgi:hypothetical protein
MPATFFIASHKGTTTKRKMGISRFITHISHLLGGEGWGEEPSDVGATTSKSNYHSKRVRESEGERRGIFVFRFGSPSSLEFEERLILRHKTNEDEKSLAR